MQDLLRTLPGVVDTRVGYSGGDMPRPTYGNHGNHAESIEITSDPAVTDYRTILEYFFQIHDPTTKNRQGNDFGASYRSVIFYLDGEQRRVAQDTIADVEASGLWPGSVVTEVVLSRRILGSRAGASGLSDALSGRVHLPLSATELAAAETGRRLILPLRRPGAKCQHRGAFEAGVRTKGLPGWRVRPRPADVAVPPRRMGERIHGQDGPTRLEGWFPTAA